MIRKEIHVKKYMRNRDDTSLVKCPMSAGRVYMDNTTISMKGSSNLTVITFVWHGILDKISVFVDEADAKVEYEKWLNSEYYNENDDEINWFDAKVVGSPVEKGDIVRVAVLVHSGIVWDMVVSKDQTKADRQLDKWEAEGYDNEQEDEMTIQLEKVK